MKKQLALAAGLAVLATPALASKARMQALGEDVDGSYYVNDNRNIFLNPAEVLNNKDLVTFEWGGAQSTDVEGDSNAEGGFLRSSGNLVWGAQMGRVTDWMHDYNEIDTQSANIEGFNTSNTLDLFIGGDAGIKWGAQVTYSDRKDDNFTAGAADDAKANEMGIAAGVSTGNIAGFVKYGVSGKSETDGDSTEIKRKSPLDLGVSYKWMDYTLFGEYSSAKYEVDQNGTENDVEKTSYQVGAGRVSKLSDKANMFTKVAYVKSNTDFDDLGGTDQENNTSTLPVTVGLEYDAASWLTLRGSVKQNVFINEQEVDGEKSTIVNSTDVNAGATLKFGDLMVDGVIGTNGTGGTRQSNTTENGVFNTDNLMSRVSMTYRF
jgi:hypothetical protein